MIGQTIAHYRILEKLGEGGMGVVYRARDTKLDRDVALKFLPPQLSSSDEEKARFTQEAKAAASLNHPNVCSIIDIGIDIAGDAGRMFIVMEFVDGRTLRSIAAAHREGEPLMDLARWTDIALQAAEGLGAAHAKGIVHRDVKSENVMLTSDGRVKIMDFGLAKIRDAAMLTRPSSSVGTVAYAPPELLRGEEVSPASDVFSLGVVLYEALTARHPFHAGHDAATMYRIINEAPAPVSSFRKDIPPNIQGVLDRMLRKNPAERYQTMADLARDLRGVSGSGIPGSAGSAGAAAERPAQSIAVLAFEDMSPQKDQDYFCEGLAEEIINSLTQVKKLRISSRTSTFSFRGKQMDVREIGRKLNVDHVLEGSVRKAGNRLRVTAQLITVADGYHAWSQRYDRELEDVFEVQDDITSQIVKALEVVLTPQEQGVLEKEKKVDVRAYEFYLKGRKAMHEQTRRMHARAIQLFEEAVRIDPGYALAYAGIADCHSFLTMYWGGSAVNREQAERASRRALELDPGLAEAHLSCGLAAVLSRRYDEAEREYTTALTLNPRLFEAHYYFARAAFLQGKYREAVEHYEEAAAINPDDYQAKLLVTSSYRSLGMSAKVPEVSREGLRRAERHLEFNPNDVRALYLGAGAHEVLGQLDKALEWADRALALEPDDPGAYYNIACLYSIAGRTEKAIECLEKALQNGFAQKDWIEKDSDLDPIREHPRYRSLLTAMNS